MRFSGGFFGIILCCCICSKDFCDDTFGKACFEDIEEKKYFLNEEANEKAIASDAERVGFRTTDGESLKVFSKYKITSQN
jgi:hypothetical protein